MAVTKAAGVLIFREITTPPPRRFEYLLLKCTKMKHWTPPKGRLDPGEDERKAAIRETQEEAGLSATKDYEILDGFEHVLKYVAWGKDKTVKYWLGRLINDAQIKLSHEHTEHAWFNCTSLKAGDYSKLILHDDTKNLLLSAEKYLTEH